MHGSSPAGHRVQQSRPAKEKITHMVRYAIRLMNMEEDHGVNLLYDRVPAENSRTDRLIRELGDMIYSTTTKPQP